MLVTLMRDVLPGADRGLPVSLGNRHFPDAALHEFNFLLVVVRSGLPASMGAPTSLIAQCFCSPAMIRSSHLVREATFMDTSYLKARKC